MLASDHFPPFIGGGHRWAALLAAGLARRGHDVTVATMWHGGMPREERYGQHRVPVHRVRQLRTAVSWTVRDRRQRHAPPFPDPISIIDLRRVIKRAEPEVAVAHGWLSFSLVPALTGTGIPLLASAHDYGYFCANRTLLHEGGPCTGPAPRKCLACAGRFYGAPKGWAAVVGVGLSRRLLVRRIAGLHSISTYVDQVSARHLLRSEATGDECARRFIVPSAFLNGDRSETAQDASRAQEIVAKLPRKPFVLFVGALRPIKGVEVLFEAYRRLHDPPPLVLIGTIEADSPDRFPEEAIVLTDVPNSAVMEAWDRALLGVAPSVWPEPLGLVAVEAIASGTPMIGTVPGGTADVLGDGAGVLVSQGDAGALAEAMQSLLDDPARRERIARAGRARSAAYQADVVLGRYERMLSELVADGDRGRR